MTFTWRKVEFRYRAILRALPRRPVAPAPGARSRARLGPTSAPPAGGRRTRRRAGHHPHHGPAGPAVTAGRARSRSDTGRGRYPDPMSLPSLCPASSACSLWSTTSCGRRRRNTATGSSTPASPLLRPTPSVPRGRPRSGSATPASAPPQTTEHSAGPGPGGTGRRVRGPTLVCRRGRYAWPPSGDRRGFGADVEHAQPWRLASKPARCASAPASSTRRACALGTGQEPTMRMPVRQATHRWWQRPQPILGSCPGRRRPPGLLHSAFAHPGSGITPPTTPRIRDRPGSPPRPVSGARPPRPRGRPARPRPA